MAKLRPISFALLTLGLSTLIMSSIQAQPTYNKGQRGGVYIQLETYDGQPNNTYLNPLPFATVDARVVDPGPPTILETEIFRLRDSDSKWCYHAALGYDLTDCYGCCNYGFSLEFTHFNNDDNFATPHLTNFIGTVGELLPTLSDADILTDASVRLDTNYHTWDLLTHKNMNVCGSHVQLFAGARYLRLRETYTADYRRILPPTIVAAVDRTIVIFENEFKGVGPRIGANVFYPFGCYFGLTGEIAGSLVYGETDANYNSTITVFTDTGAPDTITRISDHHPDNAHVVPALSGKVGLALNFQFRNCSSLQIEGGYRGDKYFNISDNSPMFAFRNSIGVGEPKSNYYSDFELTGPYFSLTFHV